MHAARTAWLLAIFVFCLVPACGSKDDATGKRGDKGVGAEHGGIPTSREGQMYLLGQKLSQAAMINGRTTPDVVARAFNAASTIADVTLRTKLAPLPTPTGDGAKDGAAGIDYLLNGPGKELGSKIATDFGATSAATYELAVKINMLPMLYVDDPQDAMGDTMAGVFGRLASAAKLPESAMGPLIAKLQARAPIKDVIDMALALNESLPVAIAKIYEKGAGGSAGSATSDGPSNSDVSATSDVPSSAGSSPSEPPADATARSGSSTKPVAAKGEPKAKTGLPPDVVQKVVKRNLSRMQLCAEKEGASGVVNVRLAVGSDGQVTDASAQKSTLSAAATQCVLDAFRRLSFPAPTGGATTVTYPIQFR